MSRERAQEGTGRETWSLSAERGCSAHEVAEVLRAHSGAENRVHYTLDVAFYEDWTGVRSGKSPIKLSPLRKMAMNTFRQEFTRLLLARSDDVRQ